MQDFFIPSLIFCFFGASGRYFKISFKQVLTTALKLNIIYPLHPRCTIEYAVVLELADRHV